jgi:hypothetical protein
MDPLAKPLACASEFTTRQCRSLRCHIQAGDFLDSGNPQPSATTAFTAGEGIGSKKSRGIRQTKTVAFAHKKRLDAGRDHHAGARINSEVAQLDAGLPGF